MARYRAIRWLAASVFALSPAGRITAQTALEAAPDPAADATSSISQSEYTLPLLPKVTCDHNQLLIEADNATLMSVLSAVETCLGVQIKPPAGFRDERTFTHLGPGPADRVLDDLLSTLDVNYAIVLSGAASRKVTSVVLSSRLADNAEDTGERAASPGSGIPMTPARRLWLASQSTSGRPLAPAEGTGEPAREPDPPIATPASRGIPESLGAGAGNVLSPSEATSSASQGDATSTSAVATGKDDSSAAASANTNQAAAAAAAATHAASVPPTAPPAPPSASDPAADPKATANVLGQQINQMQQMFEQRRKLNQPPPPAAGDPQ